MTRSDTKDGEGERIARRMARAGVASRRAAEAMIAEGRVAVNGQVIDSPALNVTPRDRITVDGAPLAAPEAPRLWRYYKPIGLVTSERDEKGRETVFSRLPEEMPRVVSVGRLDLNSEGLLLLTNDGALKRRLELPSTGWLRKYRVRAHGAATDATLEPLRRGISVDGERFQPMTVTVDRQQGSNVWLTVALREGRNREVRRALDAVGLSVNRLIRVSYGPFQLGELEPGQVEEVRPKAVREQLGLAPAPQRAAGGKRTAEAAETGQMAEPGTTGRGGAGRGASGEAARAGARKTAPGRPGEDPERQGQRKRVSGQPGSEDPKRQARRKTAGYSQKSQSGRMRDRAEGPGAVGQRVDAEAGRASPEYSQKPQTTWEAERSGEAYLQKPRPKRRVEQAGEGYSQKPQAGRPRAHEGGTKPAKAARGAQPAAGTATKPPGRSTAHAPGQPTAKPRKPLTPGPRRPK